MSEATITRHLEKAKKLLARIKHPTVPNPLIFFSDEKNFMQDQKVNRRNNRWLCSDPTEVPIVMATKFPANVMVLGIMSNKGDIMPPHIFPKGLRVNTDEFINVLETEINRGWTRSLEIAETSYRRTAPTLTTERGHKNSSRKRCWRCTRRMSWLSARLTDIFWTILGVASLSYRSMQSLTTKSRT